MDWGSEPIIVKEGYIFIALSAFLTLFAASSNFRVLSWILLVLTFFIAAFFRNPFRQMPEDTQAVICPSPAYMATWVM